MRKTNEPADAGRIEGPAPGLALASGDHRRLAELAFCGEWLINSFREGKESLDEYDALTSRLFAAAFADAPDAVERDAKTGRWRASAKFEQETLERFVDHYDEEVFWDELAHRLAWRDLYRARGAQAVDSMTADERAKALDDIEQRYWDEFEENGVDHLMIDVTGRVGSGRGPFGGKTGEA